jgi:hypothetical protein
MPGTSLEAAEDVPWVVGVVPVWAQAAVDKTSVPAAARMETMENLLFMIDPLFKASE